MSRFIDEHRGRFGVEPIAQRLQRAKRRGKPWITTTSDPARWPAGPGRARFQRAGPGPALGR